MGSEANLELRRENRQYFRLNCETWSLGERWGVSKGGGGVKGEGGGEEGLV